MITIGSIPGNTLIVVGLTVKNDPKQPFVSNPSNGRFQPIVLKNSVFGSSREHFWPHRSSSCIWRGGRPKPIFGLAVPPHVLGAVFQSDFRAPPEVGGKSTFSQTGVFQHNQPKADIAFLLLGRKGTVRCRCMPDLCCSKANLRRTPERCFALLCADLVRAKCFRMSQASPNFASGKIRHC